MKRILLGTAVLLALLTGCTDEKKTPVQTETATQDVKKDEVVPAQNEATEDMKKDEAIAVQNDTTDEMKKDEVLPIQDESTKEESK